jgi:putative spermidine/putrescine transport system ATP-binding protein
MAFLQLEGLSKRFSAIDAVVATDLAVEKGEFVSLLGPSDFVDATAGRIVLDGRDITHAKPSSRGLEGQSYALSPYMTVRNNVAFDLRMRKVWAGVRGGCAARRWQRSLPGAGAGR